MIVLSAPAAAATTDISTRVSGVKRSTTIVVRVGKSPFQNPRYASFIGPKSDAARMKTSTDTTRSSDEPALANERWTCSRMLRVSVGTSPRTVDETPLTYTSWPLWTTSGIGELYRDLTVGGGGDCVNSPIHQFTNSPIHQFTNSPIGNGAR